MKRGWLGLLVLLPALATGEELVLDTLEVRAQRQPASLVQSSDAARVEAFRGARAVTVVDGDTLRGGRAGGVMDLLDAVPGVFAAAGNGPADGFLSIRGSGLSAASFGRGTESYQDGIPLGRIDGGTVNQLVDPLAYDHLEVYRGPAGLRLGAVVSGGAINYLSRTGRSHPGTRVRVEAGSFGDRRLQLTHGGVHGGGYTERYSEGTRQFDHHVGLSHAEREGFRRQQASLETRLNANLGVRISDRTENRSYLMASRSALELAGNIPLRELRERRREAGRFNQRFDTDRNWRDVRLANRTLHRLDQYRQLQVFVAASLSELDHLPTPFVGIIDNRYHSATLGADYRQDSDTGNRFVAGLRFGVGDDRFERYRQSDDGQRKLEQIFDARFQTHQVTGYLDHQRQLGSHWRFDAGVQAVWSRRDFDDRQHEATQVCTPPGPPWPCPTADPSDTSYRVDYRGVSPRIGLFREWRPGLAAFTQLARSMDMPASSELGNLPEPEALDAQTGWTWELGSRGVTDAWHWDAIYYVAVIDDALITQTVDGSDVTVNADSETLQQSVELGLGVQLAEDLLTRDRLMLNLSWTWMDWRFRDDQRYGRNRLPKVPAHNLFAELAYRSVGGFSLGPNLRHVSRYPLTFDNRGGRDWRVPSHTLIGLRTGYRFSSGLRVFAEGRNLTDRVYATTGETRESAQAPDMANPNPSAMVTPGDGRAWHAGFEYHF